MGFFFFTIQINIIQYNTYTTYYAKLTLQGYAYAIQQRSKTYTIITSYLFTYLFNYYYFLMHTLLTITFKKTPLTERKTTQL